MPAKKTTTVKKKIATKTPRKTPTSKPKERVFPSSVDDGVIGETLAKEAQQNA